MKKYIMIGLLLVGLLTASLEINAPNNSNGTRKQNESDQEMNVLTNTLALGINEHKEWNDLSCVEQKEFLERMIMLNFNSLISDAVFNYYGEYRGSELEGITSLKRIGVVYEITIKIMTFVGPHNPPYGIDEITIRFDKLCNSGEIVDFKHTDYRNITTK